MQSQNSVSMFYSLCCFPSVKMKKSTQAIAPPMKIFLGSLFI